MSAAKVGKAAGKVAGRASKAGGITSKAPVLRTIPTHGVQLKPPGKMRRYGHVQGNKVLKGFHPMHVDLLNLYKSDKTYLYGIKKVGIVFSKTGLGNTGARWFKVERMDPLVYWNPDVEFQLQKMSRCEPKLTIEFDNGEVEEFDIKGKRSEAILDILLSKINFVQPTKNPTRLQQFLDYWNPKIEELPHAGKVTLEIEKKAEVVEQVAEEKEKENEAEQEKVVPISAN